MESIEGIEGSDDFKGMRRKGEANRGGRNGERDGAGREAYA